MTPLEQAPFTAGPGFGCHLPANALLEAVHIVSCVWTQMLLEAEEAANNPSPSPGRSLQSSKVRAIHFCFAILPMPAGLEFFLFD